MKKLLIAPVILLLTACSSAPSLQSQIDELTVKVVMLQTSVSEIKDSADKANETSTAALYAANRAAALSQETNTKLDSMFKKSMLK